MTPTPIEKKIFSYGDDLPASTLYLAACISQSLDSNDELLQSFYQANAKPNNAGAALQALRKLSFGISKDLSIKEDTVFENLILTLSQQAITHNEVIHLLTPKIINQIDRIFLINEEKLEYTQDRVLFELSLSIQHDLTIQLLEEPSYYRRLAISKLFADKGSSIAALEYGKLLSPTREDRLHEIYVGNLLIKDVDISNKYLQKAEAFLVEIVGTGEAPDLEPKLAELYHCRGENLVFKKNFKKALLNFNNALNIGHIESYKKSLECILSPLSDVKFIPSQVMKIIDSGAELNIIEAHRIKSDQKIIEEKILTWLNEENLEANVRKKIYNESCGLAIGKQYWKSNPELTSILVDLIGNPDHPLYNPDEVMKIAHEALDLGGRFLDVSDEAASSLINNDNYTSDCLRIIRLLVDEGHINARLNWGIHLHKKGHRKEALKHLESSYIEHKKNDNLEDKDRIKICLMIADIQKCENRPKKDYLKYLLEAAELGSMTGYVYAALTASEMDRFEDSLFIAKRGLEHLDNIKESGAKIKEKEFQRCFDKLNEIVEQASGGIKPPE